MRDSWIDMVFLNVKNASMLVSGKVLGTVNETVIYVIHACILPGHMQGLMMRQNGLRHGHKHCVSGACTSPSPLAGSPAPCSCT